MEGDRLPGLYTPFHQTLYPLFNQRSEGVAAHCGVGVRACERERLAVRASPRRITNLRPDESLKAGLEVVDAALVELGHLVQQLLVLGLEVFPDRSELLSSLGGRVWRGREQTKERVTIGHYRL